MVVLFSLWQGIFHVKISNCGQPDDKVSDMGHSWSRKSTFPLSLTLSLPSLSLTCLHVHIHTCAALLNVLMCCINVCVCVEHNSLSLCLSTVSFPVTNVLQKCGSCHYSV